MKKLATLLCFVAGAHFAAFAQTNIDAIEYFLDTDPGVGNGISIPITTGPIQDIDFTISTSGLTIGFHTLVLRAKHQSGVWGIEDTRVFYVTAEAAGGTGVILSVEYYIDSDPGPGNGISIPVPGSFPTSADLIENIPMTSLATGFHVFHVRAQELGGSWGIPDSRPFYLVPGGVSTQADIVQLEYFFDTEPGYGAGIPLSVTSGTSISLSSLISTSALSAGFHSISVRAKDNDGQWGFAEMRTIYIDEFSQVSLLEYFIDTDPGEGSATSVVITTGGEIDQDFTIPTAALVTGGHTLSVRAARTDGAWGNIRTTSFSVLELQSISFGALAAATYGDAPITLTGTSSSGLPLTYTSSDPLVATISGTLVTIIGAGTTIITASQPGDVNYGAAADTPQTLVVNKAGQTIAFGALTPKTVGDAPFTLGGTSTSGLGLVYISSSPGVATITGNIVTIVAAGTTNITASQTGNGNYNVAPDVVQPLVVQPATNAPSLGIQASTAFHLNTPVVINSTLAITDADGTLSSATVSITTGFQRTEDELLFDAQNGITGTYSTTTGVLTVSGPATVGDYQTALRTVRYTNSSTTPNTSDRIIAFQVSDGTTTSNAVIATVTINKPPVITAPEKETQAGGNVGFLISEIFSDPDDNLDFATLTVSSAQGALVTISSGIITINYSNLPEYQGTDQLTITVCDQGGKCQTQVVNVDIGADVDVFNGVSPNADEMNDYFRIRFLPPGSVVSIINRWGDVVYESKEYDSNDPTRRFEGNATNGNTLTNGTYFYKIVLPDGRERSGYLQLKR